MKKQENNYAFIDGQNVHLGVKELGWLLDFRRFRVYLADKYRVKKAYIFIGFIEGNQEIYRFLQEAGYILILKPVLIPKDGKPKGNVDADLVLRAMIDYPSYDHAVIITSDGDFYSLVDYLYNQGKLKIVLSPNKAKCSILLRQKAKEKIEFMDKLAFKLSRNLIKK